MSRRHRPLQSRQGGARGLEEGDRAKRVSEGERTGMRIFVDAPLKFKNKNFNFLFNNQREKNYTLRHFIKRIFSR